jgi:hypothetical protein
VPDVCQPISGADGLVVTAMNDVTWWSAHVWVFNKDKTVDVNQLLYEITLIMPFVYCDWL